MFLISLYISYGETVYVMGGRQFTLWGGDPIAVYSLSVAITLWPTHPIHQYLYICN